ncbi:MAG: DUF4097 domain-containing protein, partial [bacterium]|nr:DUF4097 domain-containing protein [bacterium]
MNKKNISIILSLLLVFVFTAAGYAQESTVDKAEVPLTDPSKPALLKASVVNGSISVTGYSGKTILVEARPAPEQSKEDQEADEEDDEADKKSKGMFRIKTTGTGLSIVEENNVAVVKVPFNSQRINLTLKVPYKTNLKVKSVHGGNVEVKKVDGDLAVSNTSGDVTLTNVGGTVVAQTTSGDVSVTFDRINLDKPMSFVTFHGDVDVTFPSNAKFNLKMK